MGRGPRGPCGLKSITRMESELGFSSRPARALWIEILSDCSMDTAREVEAREGLVD